MKDIMLLEPPKPTAEFRLGKDSNVVFCLSVQYPNAWWRFWQRVFFGFQWRRL